MGRFVSQKNPPCVLGVEDLRGHQDLAQLPGLAKAEGPIRLVLRNCRVWQEGESEWDFTVKRLIRGCFQRSGRKTDSVFGLAWNLNGVV